MWRSCSVPNHFGFAVNMKNRRLEDIAPLLLLAVLLLARPAIGSKSLFPGEFVVEDSILLLILTLGLVPRRFELVVSCVIACGVGSLMALIAWTTSAHESSSLRSVALTGSFALLAAHGASRALVELSRLRKQSGEKSGERREKAGE